MDWVALCVLGAAVLAGGVAVAAKRRRDSGMRRRARLQAATFLLSVRARVHGIFGEVAIRGPMSLLIRGDLVEISNPFPLARVLFGQEYYFRGPDIEIEVRKGTWGGDWITVEGGSSGRSVGLAITSRGRLRDIWDALVTAGATTAGPPPPPSPQRHLPLCPYPEFRWHDSSTS